MLADKTIFYEIDMILLVYKLTAVWYLELRLYRCTSWSCW